MLEQPHWALMSALWYWKLKGLNRYADKDAFTELTKRINGGTNGLQDRLVVVHLTPTTNSKTKN